MPTVFIPSLLRDLTGDLDHVELTIPEGETASVRHLLDELDRRFPGVAERLLYEGDLMPGIAVFVDGEQTRLGLRERVPPKCEIHFIPPTVGG